MSGVRSIYSTYIVHCLLLFFVIGKRTVTRQGRSVASGTETKDPKGERKMNLFSCVSGDSHVLDQPCLNGALISDPLRSRIKVL